MAMLAMLRLLVCVGLGCAVVDSARARGVSHVELDENADAALIGNSSTSDLKQVGEKPPALLSQASVLPPGATAEMVPVSPALAEDMGFIGVTEDLDKDKGGLPTKLLLADFAKEADAPSTIYPGSFCGKDAAWKTKFEQDGYVPPGFEFDGEYSLYQDLQPSSLDPEYFYVKDDGKYRISFQKFMGWSIQKRKSADWNGKRTNWYSFFNKQNHEVPENSPNIETLLSDRFQWSRRCPSGDTFPLSGETPVPSVSVP